MVLLYLYDAKVLRKNHVYVQNQGIFQLIQLV